MEPALDFDEEFEIPWDEEGELEQNPQHLKTYLGNDQIKSHRADVGYQWAKWEMQEYARCAEDIIYFAQNYVKINHIDKGLIYYDPYPYQKHMYEMLDHNRFGIVLAPRQSGKSLAFVIWLLHYAIFTEQKCIVIGAQNLGTAMEMLERITTAMENLPFFLQPGCRTLNKTSVVFSNGSKIYARATGKNTLRGLSVNVLFLDEFAIVEHSEKFYTGAYPVISSGQDSKLIITSTANGVGNMFYKLWDKAIRNQNDFAHFEVKWDDVPGRDEKWREETIGRTSERQFMQEFENKFLGGTNTLINAETMMSLSAADPIFETDDIRIYEKAKPNHEYVLTADVSEGVGGDSSTMNIIDVTRVPFRQVAAYNDNNTSPYLFSEMIVKYAKMYNEAYVCIESNDHGSVVNWSVMQDLEYDNVYTESRQKADKIGLKQTVKTKRLGCTHFKDLLEGGKLIINDNQTIQEICSFVERNGKYQAETDCHDDLVMGLVIFGYLASTDRFKNEFDAKLKDVLYSPESIEQIQMANIPPFGVISKNDGEEIKEVIQEIPIDEREQMSRFVKDDLFGVAYEEKPFEADAQNFIF